MNNKSIEPKLNSKLIKIRLSNIILFVIFMILVSVFIILRENSRETITIGESPFFTYTYYEYNDTYTLGMALSIVGSILLAITSMVSFMICRVSTVEVDGYYVTVYIGFFKKELYVNEELKDSSFYNYYLETRLDSGTLIHVSFSYNLAFARMTFSNGNNPISL